MNVANALQAKFSPEDQARLEKPPTTSAEAHALYMQARIAAERGEEANARSLLERAIKIDPQFADAYGYLSFLYSLRLVNDNRVNAVPPEDRARSEALLRQYAERALALDPEVPFVHTALAEPALTTWRWSKAEQTLARSLEVSPNDPDAPILYGFLLSWMGRKDEAIAHIKRSRQPSPRDPYAFEFAAELGYAGEFEAATELLKRVIAAQPTDLLARDWMALMAVRRGEPAAAIKQIELSEKMAGANLPFVFLPEWAYIYGRAGRKADAERLFRKIETAVERGVQPGTGGWAMAYLGVGDEKQALDWLEEAARKAANHEPEAGNLALMNLRMNVTDDPVLKKPEFADVLSRIKGD